MITGLVVSSKTDVTWQRRVERVGKSGPTKQLFDTCGRKSVSVRGVAPEHHHLSARVRSTASLSVTENLPDHVMQLTRQDAATEKSSAFEFCSALFASPRQASNNRTTLGILLPWVDKALSSK